MTRQIRIVDVFTDRSLAGNQLAVVLDGKDLSPRLMQRIAREMNFSETTFVFPPENAAHAARIRIFTPALELPFAGHPTIGTAWVLIDEGVVPKAKNEFVLEENVGPVPVRADGAMVWMTHPKLSFGQVVPHKQVAAAIGVEESDIVDDIPAQIASTGNPFLYVVLRDAEMVDRAVCERPRLEKLLHGGDLAHGVYLFADAGPNRLYGRMFAPDIGEDPATGSAAGPLGAFAVRYGVAERAAKVALVTEQGAKMGRPSTLHISLEYGDSKEIPDRIEVGGGVMPVLRGELEEFS
ncbi:MAG TPA: PhzF family phenazine biosynthesis protein [Candidatus Dormibacteraeota bacterium]